MKILKYFGIVILFSVMGILFKRYKRKFDPDEELKGNDLVKKYLLNENIIYSKPNIWIHVKKEKNTRNWINFGSRTTNDVNKPYIQICIESIIKYNQDKFNIFLIDDDSFSKLLSDWNVILSNVPEPIRGNVRRLGIMKILYTYGGISLPRSFLCMTCLQSFFESTVYKSKMFCVENVNRSVNQLENEFLPDDKIIGCIKFSEKMKNYIEFLEKSIEEDSTDEFKVLGKKNLWLNEEVEKFNIKLIDSRLVGMKSTDNVYVGIEELLGDSIISFDKNKIGIYLDECEIGKRNAYNWFNRMSKEQIFNSSTIIGEQMLLSHGN